MRYSPIPKIIGAFLLFACCFTNSNVFAHTPLAREAHGVIQSIDYQKQNLTLTYAQERGPQKLIWKSDTEFLHDGKLAPVTELKPGARVTVYYHSPFFGRPFVVKVIWNKGD